ncbi:MAG: inositol-3-phosphate synthase, partial [Corynebacterium sp.]|nr:inositol-3-phosphate synthase [Corynebacterium sp.]
MSSQDTNTIKLAIAGIGNCATSLLQGLEFYKDTPDDDTVPGLMHVRFGDYHVRDIELVAAYDVDADKVGKDVAAATESGQNCTIKICDLPELGITVRRGHTADGLGKYYRETIEESAEPDATHDDIVTALKETGADVLV